MSEILVKTFTRHRDVKSLGYMNDWTAFDVCQIMPDGYFTGNKYHGAKRMGIVLCVDGDLPSDYAGGPIFNPLLTQLNKSHRPLILGRTQKIIDLTEILSDEQLKDVFNHDLLVNPIAVKKSYLDLFIDRNERIELHPYDKSGSFDNETVDVGPNGDADANTFFELESNVAISVGPVIGNADEAFTETTAILINDTGATASNKYLKLTTSLAGRHAGKYDAAKQLISVANAIGVRTADEHVWLDGLQIYVNSSSANNQYGAYFSNVAAGALLKISNCIIRQSGNNNYSYAGIMSDDSDASLTIWNTVLYGNGTIESGNNVCIYITNNTATNVYNCTCKDGYYGICRSGGTVNVYNTIVYNTAGNALNGTFGATNYNATDDATGGTNSIDNVDFTTTSYFVDAANGDFTLTADASDVIDVTSDQSSGLFSDDIAGNARTGAWCVGASEYVAAAGSILPLIGHSLGGQCNRMTG